MVAGEEVFTAVVDLVEALDALSESGSSGNQDEVGEMEASISTPSVQASTAVKSPGKSFSVQANPSYV